MINGSAGSECWKDKAAKLDRSVCAYIDGKKIAQSSSDIFRKFCPSDGALVVEAASCDAALVDAAIASARQTFESGVWRKELISKRKSVLFEFAQLIESHAEELALADSLEMGKPISKCLSFDVPLAVRIVRYYAECMDKTRGASLPCENGYLVTHDRFPLGVVAAIVPWNFPVVNSVVKVAPALAAGNSVVLKPSELANLSAQRLVRLALEAGVPEGVLNLTPGTGAVTGQYLAEHDDVNMIGFTGSTAVGKSVMAAAAQSNLKRVALELGGKSPQIVFPDVTDLNGVAKCVAGSIFDHQGQVCAAGSRLLVHEEIKDLLVGEIIERAKARRIGHSLDPDVDFGPIVSERQMLRVLEHIEAGTSQGAECVFGGERILEATGGFYVSPTVFVQVASEMTIAQEEIFGPVLSVIGFRDVDEAIRIANDTDYGLMATAWTGDMNIAHRLADELDAGVVFINGGLPGAEGVGEAFSLDPRRRSGFGPEGGMAGLETYSSLKMRSFNYAR